MSASDPDNTRQGAVPPPVPAGSAELETPTGESTIPKPIVPAQFVSQPPQSERERATQRRLKEFTGIAVHLLLFGWDWFWKTFDLEMVGDDVKEHAKVHKRRAAVVIAIGAALIVGTSVSWYLQAQSKSTLRVQLSEAQGKLKDVEPTIRQLQQTTNELNVHIAENESIILNMRDSDARGNVLVLWSEDAFDKRHFTDSIMLYKEALELEIRSNPDHPVTASATVVYLTSCYMTNQTTEGLADLGTNLDTLISDYSRNGAFLGYFQGDLDKARNRLPTNAVPVLNQAISNILSYKARLTNR